MFKLPSVNAVREQAIDNLLQMERRAQLVFDKLIRERTWFAVLTAAVVEFRDKKLRYFTGNFTYNAFLATLALAIALAAVMGYLVAHFPGVKDQAIKSLGRVVPVVGGSPTDAMDTLARYRSVIGLISFLGLLWTGTKIFTALEWGFCHIWGSKRRSFTKRKLLGLAMVSVIGGLFFVSLFIQFAFAAFWGWAAGNSGIYYEAGNLIFKPLFTLAVNFFLFLCMYQWVPTVKQSLKRSAVGAAVGAALFLSIQYLLSFYFSHVSSIPSLYGTLATAVVLAIWLQMTGMIIFLGAEITHVLYNRQLIEEYKQSGSFETLFLAGRNLGAPGTPDTTEEASMSARDAGSAG